MTTFLTIDAGLVIKLVTQNPQPQKYVALFTTLYKEGYQLIAPTLWLYEVTSTLTKLAYFQHISRDSSRRGLDLAFGLDVQLIAPTPMLAQKAMVWTQRLGRTVSYDSFYLALAQEFGCEFWTTDKKLFNAVGEPWVKWFD